MDSLRIFLADDHGVVRAGLRALIDAETDMEVIGEAENGREAVEGVSSSLPDVAVLDVSMPELNGAQVTRLLKKTNPTIAVIGLTVHEDASYLRELMEAGADGYVLKRAAADELIRAIRAVAAGGVYVDPRIAGRLVSTFVDRPASPGKGPVELSEREREVLRAVAQGYSNKEIAAQLKISVKTVETYKARSMEKLSLRSRVDIVRYAIDQQWLA